MELHVTELLAWAEDQAKLGRLDLMLDGLAIAKSALDEGHAVFPVPLAVPLAVSVRKGDGVELLVELEKFAQKDAGKPDRELWQRWRKLVNMTAGELRRFLASEEGQQAGLSPSEARRQGIKSGRESARAILRMLPKGGSYGAAERNWSEVDWRWAGRQVSFISRMLGNRGPLRDSKDRPTRKLLSLLVWGHNPEK